MLSGILHRLTSVLPRRPQGVYNLNDPQWGRGDDGSSSEQERPRNAQPQRPSQDPQSPPDLDELWRDFNRRISGLFGGKGGGGGQSPAGGGQGPSGKATGIGAGLIAVALLVIWLGSGFFIVQEGQQAVITQFGRYHGTVNAGFNWRLPYPIQAHETVFVTQIRSVDVGSDSIVRTTGLRESAMLTADENIVEIKFAVQYRLSDARAYLFESRNPDAAVVSAAETAVREVGGKMKMDSALAEERDQIGPRVRQLMQTILDRYKVGIEVVGVNLQQGGVRPPEQVQAAFDDVLKAAQERERAKNEAQAYANDVIPRAGGQASRLREEAEAYKARIVAQAQGDASRFEQLYAEYKKAPKVTRDRLYLDTMRDVYANVTKVVIESRQGSNMLYLPLDQLLANTQNGAAPSTAASRMAPTLPTLGALANSQNDTRNSADPRTDRSRGTR